MANQSYKNDTDETGAWLYKPSQALSYTIKNMEIIFVLDGKLDVESEGNTYRLKEADILLFNPPLSSYERALPQRVKLSPMENCCMLLLRISPSFLLTVFSGKIPVFDCNSCSKSGDYGALRSILGEIASADTTMELLFYSRLYRLLNELNVNFTSEKDDILRETKDEEKRRQMVYSYIGRHFRETISLEEISDAFSLSPQYFSKYFKNTFGVNFHSYIKQLRLQAAMRELINTDKSVTAIAHDNGFPNHPALIKEMRETVKQTPSSYRKAHQNNGQEKNREMEESFEIIDSELIKDKLAPFVIGNTDALNKQIKITLDARNSSSFEKPWQEVINLGFVTDFEKSDFINHIKFLQEEAPFRYARFEGIFGKGMLTLSNIAEFSFVKIDRIIDFLYSVQLLPFIELGLKPNQISKNMEFLYYKADEIESIPMDEYRKLIDAFLKYSINRYGIQEVSRWRFEYWKPRDGFGWPLPDEIDDFIDNFTLIRETIKKRVPQAQVGGFGLYTQWPGSENYFTKLMQKLRDNNIVPDFFSYYLFHVSRTEGPDATGREQVNRILFAREEIKNRIDLIMGHGEKLKDPLFYITEWNLDFSSRNIIHDSLFKAPFIIKSAIDTMDNFGALAYWLASDISAEYTDSNAPLFGGPGLISRNGIRKPAFFAYQFLSKLGGQLLAKGEDHIITAKSDDEFVAILFNYKYISNSKRFLEQLWFSSGSLKDYLEDTEKCSISLEIRDISPGQYKIRQHILNSSHGSIYDTWMGLSAVQNLRTSEVSWLERACFPDLRIDFLNARGSLTIDCELEANEVRLLEISRIFE